VVAATLSAGWLGAKLGARLKSSQNVTYSGELANGQARALVVYAVSCGRVRLTLAARSEQKVIVRATATPGCLPRVTDELTFLRYVAAAGVRACGPIEPGLCVSGDDGAGDTVVVVTRFAEGAPVNFVAWIWATDAALVAEQGRWLGQLHAASKRFARDHADIAARIQMWDQVHDSILAGAQNKPPIEETAADGFGVIHGDVNPSNFYVDDHGRLDVFDFDQTQRAWFLYDLAQPIWAVRMASRGGVPGLTGDNAPRLDEAAFTAALCRGYGEPVDREALEACVLLRREMYERFCRRAKGEGDLPPDMAAFIEHVVSAFDANTL
jgi:aminoglycoside phosphotransferase (APT) family kinase protein